MSISSFLPNTTSYSPLSTSWGSSGTSSGTTSGTGSLWDSISNLFSGFSDTTNAQGVTTQGWGNTALSGLSGLAQTWMGFDQLNQSEDQFNFQKDLAIANYNQQASLLNSQLEDRQRARLGSDASTGNSYYSSVSDYMSQYGASEYS